MEELPGESLQSGIWEPLRNIDMIMSSGVSNPKCSYSQRDLGKILSLHKDELMAMKWEKTLKFSEYLSFQTQVKTLEYIKRHSKQPEMSHFTDLALRLPLQSRTWSVPLPRSHLHKGAWNQGQNSLIYILTAGVQCIFTFLSETHLLGHSKGKTVLSAII